MAKTKKNSGKNRKSNNGTNSKDENVCDNQGNPGDFLGCPKSRSENFPGCERLIDFLGTISKNRWC